MKKMDKTKKTSFSTLILLLILPAATSAAENNSASGWANPLLWLMITIIILLAFAITALAGVIKNISDNSGNKPEDTTGKSTEKQASPGKINGMHLFIAFSLIGLSTSAATNPGSGAESIAGIPFNDFYFLFAIILAEIITIFTLLNIIKLRYPAVERKKTTTAKKEISILEKINVSVDIEREEEILLDHDYDGIRELDNQLPPWWKYGFYLTILISIIYLLHYHVLKTGDLQVAELEKNIKTENEKVAAYLKESASNVDELTVKYLDNPTDKAAGQEIFQSLCTSCHGRLGEGTVGPNLTDNFWIHGGSISDVFKSIKYGWSEKGMRSWKDELSPVKIAQVTSYIKSIVGSKPPNAKEKQGELYQEEGTIITDSTSTSATKQDSIPSGS